MKTQHGFYIIFEGCHGTGKTTQSKKLFEFLKKKFPHKEIIWTREPGGGEITESIRKLVQGTKFSEEMDPHCEAYLYAASRAQSLRRIVKPVLEKNGISFSSYNTTSNTRLGEVVEVLALSSNASFYSAMLLGVDPTAIPFVDFLKANLKK